jgi:hypothetical protein
MRGCVGGIPRNLWDPGRAGRNDGINRGRGMMIGVGNGAGGMTKGKGPMSIEHKWAAGVLAGQPLEIAATLGARGARYGAFPDQARISQNIKRAMSDSPNWAKLSPDQREALEMVAMKVSRILNGDPNYHDSWHDIEGYVRLVAEELAQ